MDNLKSGQNLSAKGGSRKKRILMVTRPISPPWDEASKNFAFTLAKNLPDFEFGLLTNGIMEDIPDNIKQYPIYSSNNFNAWQKIKLIMNLKKISCDFDIIHCLFTPTKFNSFLLSNLLSNKGIVTIQTVATLREDLYSDKEIKKILFADKIVTYSNYSKEKLEKLGFDNIERIFPGIDLDLYKPEEKDKNLIEDLKLKIENFIITYPGEYTRLGATDDILNLIYQHASTLSANNIKIIFACRVKNKKDDNKKKEIKSILKKKGLTDLVRLPDTFTTMEKVFNLSDVVIFPVRDMKGKFDVPLAVIEAMACAKPVILSDLPIFREFADEKNSVIIERGRADKLFNSIMELFENKEKRDAIGKNARKNVEKNFDIRVVAKNYGRIYEKL